MKRGKATAAGILAAVLFFVHMAAPVMAEEKAPGNLYSLSAVLMDGDSGRVLYGKKRMFQDRMPVLQRFLPVFWHWKMHRGTIM